MSTSTTPTTFSDLQTATLNAVRGNTSETAAVTIVKRLLNQGLHDLHIQQNWTWSERRDVLVTRPPYATGSVSIAAATRTTLEGASTLWNTAVTGLGFANATAYGKISFSGETDVYTLASVASDTSATLLNRYVGNHDTASAYALAYSDYTYFEDEYALASDFWRPIDLRNFDEPGTVEVISSKDFYRRYPRNNRRTRPEVCTIIELGPSGDANPRRRVVFHPVPDAVYLFPYRYVTTNLAVSSTGTAQTQMTSDDDQPIIPLRYRHVLVLYAAQQWYRDRKDDARSQEAGAEYVDLVKRMANDTEPQRDRPRFQPMRGPYRAGVAGPRRSRYWQTGDAFDQMRDP